MPSWRRSAGRRICSARCASAGRIRSGARAPPCANCCGSDPADAIVCQQPWALVVFGSVVRALGYPVTLWLHMAGDGRHWLERAARFTAPDAVVCNSRFSQGRAAGWLPRVPAQVVYCPVSAPAPRESGARRALRHRLGVDDDRPVIAMAARAEPWKGHRVLVDACARLSGQTDWSCWLVGGAQRDTEIAYVAELRRRIEEAGLAARVQLLGTRDDAREVMAAADIYCQPNLEPEPFGLSLVEAMYAGLPVVTSAAGGALEIVDETCGVLTATGRRGRRVRRPWTAARRCAAARPAGPLGAAARDRACAPPSCSCPTSSGCWRRPCATRRAPRTRRRAG